MTLYQYHLFIYNSVKSTICMIKKWRKKYTCAFLTNLTKATVQFELPMPELHRGQN